MPGDEWGDLTQAIAIGGMFINEEELEEKD